MIVRRAQPADAREAAAIRVAGWRAAYRGIVSDSFLASLSVDEIAARWAKRFAEPDSQTLVCEHDGRLVGFVSPMPSRDEDAAGRQVGEIAALYILPGEWRHGHGRALMQAALALLRDQGYPEVTLWVLRDNGRARRFYEAQGFAVDGATKVDKRADLELHEVRYRRRLETSEVSETSEV